MRHCLYILLLLSGIFAFCDRCKAQTATAPKERSFGIGVAACFPPDALIADPPKGIHAYYRQNRHRVYAQLDIYRISSGSSLLGGQAGYRYYFSKHFFADTKAIYRQFGSGKQAHCQYNFDFNTGSKYNLQRFRTFINLAGIGYSLKMSPSLQLWVSGGGGYNYYSSELSDSYYPIFADAQKQKESYLKAVAYLDLGFSLELYNSLKPAKKKKERKKTEEIGWD